jgi:large-conductance mechanosensitive channel
MSGAERAEVYFIAAMMVLILILCAVAVFIFIKTYKKEMREKQERAARKPSNNATKNAGQE